MRHFRSILYAVVLAPAVWILAAVGFTQDLTTRGRDDFAVESLGGLSLLLLAGAAYAILLLAPISPAGPLLGGLAFLGVSIWALASPADYAALWPASVTKDGFDLSRPGYGLAAMLAIPLVCTALSARRWERYEPPVLPLIGQIGRFRATAPAPTVPAAVLETTVLHRASDPNPTTVMRLAPQPPTTDSTTAVVVPGTNPTVPGSDPTVAFTSPPSAGSTPGFSAASSTGSPAGYSTGSSTGSPVGSSTGSFTDDPTVAVRDNTEPTRPGARAGMTEPITADADEPTANDAPTAATQDYQPTGATADDDPTTVTAKDKLIVAAAGGEPTTVTGADKPTVTTPAQGHPAVTATDEPSVTTTDDEPTTVFASDEPTVAAPSPAEGEPTADSDEPTVAGSQVTAPASKTGRPSEAPAAKPLHVEPVTTAYDSSEGDLESTPSRLIAPTSHSTGVVVSSDEAATVASLGQTPTPTPPSDPTAETPTPPSEPSEPSEVTTEALASSSEPTEPVEVTASASEPTEPVEITASASEPTEPIEVTAAAAEASTDDETTGDAEATSTIGAVSPDSDTTRSLKAPDSEPTQAIKLPGLESGMAIPAYEPSTTVPGGVQPARPGDDETTRSLTGDQTQVIRLSQPDPEKTQVVRPGSVEPPGDRTEIIRLQPSPAEAAVKKPAASIADAEQPDISDDPTSRIVPPGPRVEEPEKREMTVMSMERPPDEIPAQRKPAGD
ncbi:hypothetical protein [Paractinoplanes atraurantiacus]|uniref:Uncharacterized protein n=1 Tax=Paractinoplanes atraurantiacus TaxID=1036182 RepID=A0A285GY90_9ACTN|nr:hypothetical protein [Actinoplanes atraurantiacus]SNY28482.1 hypothetical protein SAMN05421748_10389 [Actinoplanes atraurantiacus]